VTRDYGVHDFERAAARLDQQLAAELETIRVREKQHQARLADLQLLRDETLTQLVQVLLPSLAPADTTRAGRVAGYGRLLVAAEVQGRLEAERTQLAARVAELEADPRFRDRELLRAPRVGQLARELDELVDFRAPMAELWERAAHPRRDELIASGYGTDAYQVPWWRLSYYSDWKAGDEILEKFPGKAAFAEIRDELIAARDTLATYDRRLDELRAEIAAGEALERAHADASARLGNLDAIHLEGWRKLLARHLTETDLAEIGDRLAGEEAASLLFKTFVGVNKKIEYLNQVYTTQVEAYRISIANERHKLAHERAKYARPKKAGTRFPADRFEKRFGDRRERQGKFWKRYERTHDTIWGFHHYERASFVEDFLWWDLFTDGQIDGNFIPEVQEFHHHHPGYSWQGHHDIDDDLAGQAAAASIVADRAATERDPEPRSFVDPS
jgi:hypothetical protein